MGGLALTRRRDASPLDDALELLKLTPMWAGPTLALAVFLVFRYGVPLLTPAPKNGMDPGAVTREFMPLLAWLLGGGILCAWVAAEFHKLFNRRLLDRQTGINSIRDLSWPEFERLVCEAYRRQGYLAAGVGGTSGDGGVDVELTGPGEKVVVQCKQWRAYKVGVTTVRELLGVVVSRRATKGIVVTSGRFTREAVRFAEQNRQLELVDGPRLAELVAGVRAEKQPAHAVPPPPTPVASPPTKPSCPSCGTFMVLRTARKGRSAGSQFWGCPSYPGCRGTRPL
jgi:restriction system protein